MKSHSWLSKRRCKARSDVVAVKSPVASSVGTVLLSADLDADGGGPSRLLQRGRTSCSRSSLDRLLAELCFFCKDILDACAVHGFSSLRIPCLLTGIQRHHVLQASTVKAIISTMHRYCSISQSTEIALPKDSISGFKLPG